MQSKRHYPVRRHPGQHSAASSAFETLESRQLMSVAAPSAEPMGAMLAAVPAGTSLNVPLVAPAAPDGGAVSPTAGAAGVTVVVPDNGTEDPPPAGDGTAEARSLWDRLKGAAKWVKNHVTATLHSIGIKGTF